MSTKNHPSSSTTPAKPAPTLQRLPAAQLRRLPRPRSGFEQFEALFAKLVAEHGEELGKVDVDLDAMRTALRNAEALAPARAAAEADLARAVAEVGRIDDAETVQLSTAWKEMLLLYGRGQQVGRTSGEVEADLAPFTRFMKVGPRQKKATTP